MKKLMMKQSKNKEKLFSHAVLLGKKGQRRRWLSRKASLYYIKGTRHCFTQKCVTIRNSFITSRKSPDRQIPISVPRNLWIDVSGQHGSSKVMKGSVG